MPIHHIRIIAVLIACLSAFGCASSVTSTPISGRYLGQTEAQIRAKLGMPTRSWDGHYGLPPVDFTRRFTASVKSLAYDKPAGTQYLTFEERDGEWVCVASDWLPEGWVF